ncbi:MAG: hypothetical protein KBC12_03190 [Candidatus Pacebacteria bacterium]|jgi:hypothetical protein|nr:hypothetical protein [Candidatus Paceibacterota bacterium]MBP9851297.1 hypothetical protein [Candidatus Paceibacterota bacterium]
MGGLEGPKLPPQPPIDEAETRKYQDVVADRKAGKVEEGETYNLPADYEGGAGEPVFRVQYEIKYTRADSSTYTREGLGESTDVILRKSDLEALQALKAGDVVPSDSRFPEIFWGVTISDKYKIREDHAPGTRLLYLIKTSAGGNVQPNYPNS